MNFLKKQAAGFYITVLTVVLAVASVVSYLINCGTDYFSKMENHFGLVVCLLIAVVLDIIYIAGVNKKGPEKYFDADSGCMRSTFYGSICTLSGGTRIRASLQSCL